MSAHTPGPWWVSDQDVLTGATNGFDVMRGEMGTSELVCVAADLRSRDDAHLIAAAPDMLAELDQSVVTIESSDADPDMLLAQLRANFIAAIAKARGGK